MSDINSDFFDRLVRLPGDDAADLLLGMVQDINSNDGADGGQRLVMVQMICDQLNAAIARRDARTLH